MVEIMSVAGLCITASLLCRVIGKYNREQAVITSIAVITAVLAGVFLIISPVISVILNIFDRSGIENENIQIIFKALGISYITQLTGDICRDCGESSIASSAETAGKIMLVIISLPLFQELVSIVNGLL